MDRLDLVVSDPRVLDAFRAVPRELFVPEPERVHAYEDRALPLVEDQTISQPSMIALMLEELAVEPTHRVLEIGAGCGYAAALLARLAREVYGVEIRPTLAAMARASLARAGIDNAHIIVGDGSLGFEPAAPYDRILVSAGATRVPAPLIEQLTPGGRIAIPVGDESGQTLRIGRKGTNGTHVEWKDGVACVFVPLVQA
jgi:protein-L-isoaspartate(D-aspartate) O-methyltransferase